MDNTERLLRSLKADAMLTESADLRMYLTGFTSSFGFVYTDAQESIFFTDPRYAEAAKNALSGSYIAVEVAKEQKSVLDYIKSKKIKHLAVPLERLSFPQAELLRSMKFKLCDSMPAFRDAMAVKSEEEISYISRACQIAEKAYLQFIGEIKEGMTENEAAGYLEYLMRKGGAEDRSFETIVAFGKNTSVPHHAPDQTALKAGMPVLLDFGCKYKGYCSDMTRTFCFGKGADPSFFEAYEAVLSAQQLATEQIVSGISGRDADAIARGYLQKFNLDKFFTHSLGHGIGINIHEYPNLSPKSEAVLRDRMTFSIEPGVYFEGKFGIRIENTVMLQDGKIFDFMKTDKKLMVL